MQKLAKRVPGLDDDLLIWAIIKRLRPFIKASVIQHKAEVKTLADLLQHAKLAESVGAGTADDNLDDFYSIVRSTCPSVEMEAGKSNAPAFRTEGRRPSPEETVAANKLRHCGDPDIIVDIKNENMVTPGRRQVRPTSPGVDQTTVQHRSLSPIGPPSWQRQQGVDRRRCACNDIFASFRVGTGNISSVSVYL